MVSNALKHTDFKFPKQTGAYFGKVRDVYFIEDDYLLMVATDRISAFDVVLPEGIPFKGQVLNQIAAYFLDNTKDIVPNWKIDTPDPMATFGLRCEPFKVEMIIRGNIVGSAWRLYKEGGRSISGVTLPEGLKENQFFDKPIITPSTKAEEGHDENISKEEIIKQGLVSAEDYEQIEAITYKLFERGQQMARERGLILVDTKYEFGKKDGKIYLIDEIHTPDSSRYFYLEGFEERLKESQPQKQLSKEFVRKWLMDNKFYGNEGDNLPEITPEYVSSVSDRYIELYEKVVGKPFVREESQDLLKRIEQNSLTSIEKWVK